jgi:hypothetical protein
MTRYDDMLPAFAKTRSDDTVMLAFTLLNRRLDYHGFTPRFSYVFSEQHSNIPIYSFTRNQFQIGLRRCLERQKKRLFPAVDAVLS